MQHSFGADGRSDEVYTTVYDDAAPNFRFSSGGGWSAPTVDLDGYYDLTKHQTGSAGDKVDISCVWLCPLDEGG